MRAYHQDTTNNSGSAQNLMAISPQNSNNNGSNSTHFEQIKQENVTLKYEITNLQKSLAEAQIYSRTAYDTFQALREKFGN